MVEKAALFDATRQDARCRILKERCKLPKTQLFRIGTFAAFGFYQIGHAFLFNNKIQFHPVLIAEIKQIGARNESFFQ